MNIGQKIKMIRLFLDFNQTEFAQTIGITHGALSKIESGRVDTSISIIEKIARLYKISLDWLVLDEGEPPKILSFDNKSNETEALIRTIKASVVNKAC